MKNNTDKQGIDIILRALEPEDLELLYNWENDTETWSVSNTITPFSKHILQKFIENSHLDIYQTKQLRLMIEIKTGDKESFKTIGAIDLFDFDPFHNRAGVGILIGEKGERKKGYASLALGELIKYAFYTLQLHQLYCNIAETNKESLVLFEKYGFSVSGKKKEWLKTQNGYIHEYILQLINPGNGPDL